MNETFPVVGEWIPVQFSEMKVDDACIALSYSWKEEPDKTINHIVEVFSELVTRALAEGAKGVSASWQNKLDLHENPDGYIGKLRLVYQR